MMDAPSTYIHPASGDPLLFGDVFSAKWLFDAMINEEVVPLTAFSARGGVTAYTPLDPKTKRKTSLVLARGERCRAILLSDDCEAETWLVRKGGAGRLLFAAIEPWPSDPEEASRIQASNAFRRHPLPPADGFDGGVVELVRLFAVSGKALLDKSGRVVGLGAGARADLEQRWAAHATRRGPLAAVDNATKLAHVLDAGDNPGQWELLLGGDALPRESARAAGEKLATALAQSWRVEGEIIAPIADAHEARASDSDAVTTLQAELRKLAQTAIEAADALDVAAASS